MLNWNVDAEGRVRAEPVLEVSTGISFGASADPFVVLRVNDINNNISQFVMNPRQAAKLAELLAITAKNALYSSKLLKN